MFVPYTICYLQYEGAPDLSLTYLSDEIYLIIYYVLNNQELRK